MSPEFPPRRILVATDFSDSSKTALATARAWAARFGSLLELVHVQQPDVFPPESELMGLALLSAVREEERHSRRMRRRLRRLAPSDAPGGAESRVVVGFPAGIISELADPAHADLVVVGVHDRHGVASAIFGSVTEGVMRRARVPVLALHRRSPATEPRRVLCPVGLTENSAHALKYAVRTAAEFGAKLCAMFAYENGTYEEARWSLQNYLRATLGEAGREVETLVTRGDPSEEIVRNAARHGAFDLIVLSERLHPWSAERFLGTPAERASREGSIPVLAVPAEIPEREPQPSWLRQPARRLLRLTHLA